MKRFLLQFIGVGRAQAKVTMAMSGWAHGTATSSTSTGAKTTSVANRRNNSRGRRVHRLRSRHEEEEEDANDELEKRFGDVSIYHKRKPLPSFKTATSSSSSSLQRTRPLNPRATSSNGSVNASTRLNTHPDPKPKASGNSRGTTTKNNTSSVPSRRNRPALGQRSRQKRNAITRADSSSSVTASTVSPSPATATSPIGAKRQRPRRKPKGVANPLQNTTLQPKNALAPAEEEYASGSDSSSEDELYPVDAKAPSHHQQPSAFTEKLTLFSAQKKIPKRVSREAVIDLVFSALFSSSRNRNGQQPRAPRGPSNWDDSDTCSDNDQPNEEFVKKSLAATLFHQAEFAGQTNIELRKSSNSSTLRHACSSNVTAQDALDQYLTSRLVHSLVDQTRYEDFRTASARIDIVRAILKNFPQKTLDVSRALADAALMRLIHIKHKYQKASHYEIELVKVRSDADDATCTKETLAGGNDHGHGFTEILRYAIEHLPDAMHLELPGAVSSSSEIVQNLLRTWLCLWKSHWLDPAGTDQDELVTCAGQFVAYAPESANQLVVSIVANWPTRFPNCEVDTIRLLARVLMSSTRCDDETLVRVFRQLAKCVQSCHLQVAQEALAFSCCQFCLMEFVAPSRAIFLVLSEALHANTTGHWHAEIRERSEKNFDQILDFAS